MSKGSKTKKRLREPVNGLMHLVGGLLASVGLIVLLVTATNAGRMDQLVAFAVFGFSLIALYTASALYHLLPLSPASIAKLRRVDHMTIFVLIAGTYTPYCLLAMNTRQLRESGEVKRIFHRGDCYRRLKDELGIE